MLDVSSLSLPVCRYVLATEQAAVTCQVGRCTPIEALANQYRQLEYSNINAAAL